MQPGARMESHGGDLDSSWQKSHLFLIALQSKALPLSSRSLSFFTIDTVQHVDDQRCLANRIHSRVRNREVRLTRKGYWPKCPLYSYSLGTILQVR